VRGVLILVTAGVEVLDHPVLVLDVLLDALQVLGDLAVGLLPQPVDRVLLPLGRRQNVLDRVSHDEVLIGLQPEDGLVGVLGDGVLLVGAVVGEVAD
jgi:hypothetical protein